jgi:UDP-N-acetylglucosamine 2-epimerase (non-hydrolysing)
VAVVVGTRPEIIKLAFVVHELGAGAQVVYTGQHYDETLAGTFFDTFSMPRPHEVVLIGGLSRGEQIGEGTSALTRLWTAHRPAATVVQGDTNSALAGALAAIALGIPMAHVEAGLRSFDRHMPEEHNRVLIDHLADLCLAPTEVSRANLIREGITAHIEVTGNTIIEAVQAMVPKHHDRLAILAEHHLAPQAFILATFHRPENVDVGDSLETILRQLGRLPLPVVLPVHPRTAKRIADFGLQPLLAPLHLMPALDYRAFLALASEASLLISDSGGIQEEATVLKRPVVVVRRSTERPEILGTFGQIVNPEQLRVAAEEVLRDLSRIHATLAALPSPYGSGAASHLTVLAIQALIQRMRTYHVTPGKVDAACQALSK